MLLGFVLGIIAGFVLFVGTYPFLGHSRNPLWQIAVFDGVVITAVGLFAYFFRKRSFFFRGLLAATAVLFLVNGLCGVSGK